MSDEIAPCHRCGTPKPVNAMCNATAECIADEEFLQRRRMQIVCTPTVDACVVCEQMIFWQPCPTGGWWIHELHPIDGHDAKPRQRELLDFIMRKWDTPIFDQLREELEDDLSPYPPPPKVCDHGLTHRHFYWKRAQLLRCEGPNA